MKLSRIGRWDNINAVWCLLVQCPLHFALPNTILQSKMRNFQPLHIERLFWFQLIANSFCVRRVIDRNPNTDATTTGGEKIDKLLLLLFGLWVFNFAWRTHSETAPVWGLDRHWKIAEGSNLERVHEISISFEMNFSHVINHLIDTIEMNVWHWPD